MVEEEYEFDILWDTRKELWVATLRPGNYLINVKAKGFKEFNQHIQLDRRDYTFALTPLNKNIQHIHFMAVDIKSG